LEDEDEPSLIPTFDLVRPQGTGTTAEGVGAQRR
jgi:hypothetical protein